MQPPVSGAASSVRERRVAATTSPTTRQGNVAFDLPADANSGLGASSSGFNSGGPVTSSAGGDNSTAAHVRITIPASPLQPGQTLRNSQQRSGLFANNNGSSTFNNNSANRGRSPPNRLGRSADGGSTSELDGDGSGSGASPHLLLQNQQQQAGPIRRMLVGAERRCWSLVSMLSFGRVQPLPSYGGRKAVIRSWRFWNAFSTRAVVVSVLVLVLLLLCVGIVSEPSPEGGERSDARQADAIDGRMLASNPADFVRRNAPDWKAYFVVLNLFNNEALLPEYTARMEGLLRDVLVPAAGQDPTRVFVSVMSNGNSDSTAELLDGPFTSMLKRNSVGFDVHSNATACAAWGRPLKDGGIGDETEDEQSLTTSVGTRRGAGFAHRPRGMNRIDWMACIRNAAMRPLYTRGLELFAPAAGAAAKGGAPASRSSIRMIDGQLLTPDNVAVLFFNDIYFYPNDIADLLATNGGAVDLACGMDYYYAFYDTWVTRDIDGARFDPYPPFAAHPRTQRAIANGFESRVRCCWNGVALIRGSVFIDRRVNGGGAAAPRTATHWFEDANRGGPLRFRSNTTDDGCFSSECQHLCADMLGQGRDRIFLNPRVRVTYEAYFDRLQHHSWWYSPAIFAWVLSWVRISRWPLFYSPPDPSRLSTSGLQCVTVEETYTTSPLVAGLWFGALLLVCVAVNVALASRALAAFSRAASRK